MPELDEAIRTVRLLRSRLSSAAKLSVRYNKGSVVKRKTVLKAMYAEALDVVLKYVEDHERTRSEP